MSAKILEKISKLTNVDGWINVFTGLGIKGKDKRASISIQWQPIQEQEAGDLYAQDSISAKIVDLLPEEAFKKDYKITGLEEVERKRLEEEIKRLKLNDKTLDTCKWSRLYGGAALLPITKDTKPLDEDFSLGSEIIGFQVFNRWELQAQANYIQTDISSILFGKPTQFMLQPRGVPAAYSIFINRSRLGIMFGTKLPNLNMQQNNYWGDSVLTRMIPALQSYAGAHDSAANVLNDFRTAIFKIKGLSDALASNADDSVIKRLEMVNLSRSVARAIVVDADGEDFEYRESSLSGVNELITKAEDRLVAESEYPHTILLGQSPNGSNATGNSTMTNWYDYVAGYQKNEIKPVLLPMIQRIAAGIGIKQVYKIDIEFIPLMVMDEKEQAEIRKSQAETDQIYMMEGVIDPREVAISRFGGDKYSTETKIESQLREQKPITEETSSITQTDPNAPDTIKDVALNGAQVSSLIEVVNQVAQGFIPRETGLNIISTAFAIEASQADKLMGSVGNGFTPKPQDISKPSYDEDEIENNIIELEYEHDCLTLDGGPGSGPQGGEGGGSTKESAARFKSADKKVESTGNAFDKNPSPENESKLKAALQERSAAQEAHHENLKSKIASAKASQAEHSAIKGKVSEAQKNVSEIESKLSEVKARKEAAIAASAASKEKIAALKAKLATYKKK